jgi:hypothetical protein
MPAIGRAFGAGFSSELTEPSSSTAHVTKSSGTVLRFSNPNPETGYYQGPSGVGTTLQKTKDGWIERLPNHYHMHYDSSGSLVKIVLQTRDKWTIHFEGGQVCAIESPFGRRMKLTLDGKGATNRITDQTD